MSQGIGDTTQVSAHVEGVLHYRCVVLNEGYNFRQCIPSTLAEVRPARIETRANE
jgi:hypothetical protein